VTAFFFSASQVLSNKGLSQLLIRYGHIKSDMKTGEDDGLFFDLGFHMLPESKYVSKSVIIIASSMVNIDV
jgi:hypothetical protein